MKFSLSRKKAACKHDVYCSFSTSVCVETNMQDACAMKNSEIDDMPLLKTIKERVERDNQRQKEKKS